MANEVFVDTSGWYALLDRRDAGHATARSRLTAILDQRWRLVTSDYVIAETATLTKARAGSHASERFFQFIENTEALRVEWVAAERFDAAKAFFRKHADHAFSFVDCVSFIIMRELQITEALTFDAHFMEAGFAVLSMHE